MSRVINQFAKDSFGYTLSMFRKLNASFLHQSGVELEDRSTILGQTPDVHKRHYDVDDVERILKESIEHQNRLLQEIDRKEFGVG
jgi:hypothetical protein